MHISPNSEEVSSSLKMELGLVPASRRVQVLLSNFFLVNLVFLTSMCTEESYPATVSSKKWPRLNYQVAIRLLFVASQVIFCWLVNEGWGYLRRFDQSECLLHFHESEVDRGQDWLQLGGRINITSGRCAFLGWKYVQRLGWLPLTLARHLLLQPLWDPWTCLWPPWERYEQICN